VGTGPGLGRVQSAQVSRKTFVGGVALPPPRFEL